MYGDKAENLGEVNEAKTRQLLIDKILRVLGWSDDDFNPEQRVGSAGYIDYLLKADGIPYLVVEGKRTSYTFGPPYKQSRKSVYRLNYLRSAFRQPFSDVLDQAKKYAVQSGVPFAVLTNGGEWVLVQLMLSPGFTNLNDLNAVYFGNILTERFEFDYFWELLFRWHVQEGSLETHFAQLNCTEAEFSRTLRSKLGDLRWRKVSEPLLQDFYYNFFGDITDPGRRRMLEKCFVSNAQLDHYQGELQRALRDTVPPFIESAVDISPEERDQILLPASGDQKGRVVVVTGRVGCGKSTLVTKVLVETRQGDTLVALVIDLINEAASSAEKVEALLWRYIAKEWERAEEESLEYRELMRIFEKDIARLKRGPLARVFEENEAEFERHKAELVDRLQSDPEIFFERCWRYYRLQKKGLMVFFDNVDRASESFQRKVYEFAHKLADQTGATVIITMREFTFFRGKVAGFLDVRSSDAVFHLRTPNLLQVLSRRIKYVEELENQMEDHRAREWRRRRDWAVFQQQMQVHARALKKTFLQSETRYRALGVLDAVAWNNVRLFLDLLGQLHAMLGSCSAPWGFSAIVGALMTPNFAGGASVISDIFRPPFQNQQGYFLKIRLLLMLLYAQPSHEMRHGISASSLLSFLNFYRYHLPWSRRAIEELVRERFLECLEAPTEEDFTKDYKLSEAHSFRPSPLAVVLVEQILGEPIYLSLAGYTLPFHNPATIDIYERTLREVRQAFDEQQLDATALDLLNETELAHIVTRYLLAMYENEQPSGNLLNHVPEIGATEDKLAQIISSLRSFAGVERPVGQTYDAALSRQLPLNGLLHPIEPHPAADIPPIPSNIRDMRLARSEYPPLIFWALVALRKWGHESAVGVQITKVINEYLVDENNAKAPNNVSRALRSDLLQTQPWLATTVISPRKKIFGLASGWEAHWEQIFGESPPII